MINGLFLFDGLLLATETSEHSGFGLNTDIFQTNLINIIIILVILINFGRGFLGKLLSERLKVIETAIADAESRKQKAQALLAEQEVKLAAVQAECDRLKAKAEEDAQAAGETILATIAADIDRLKLAAQRELASEQEQVILQLRQQVVQKSLAQVKGYFDQGLSESAQTELVDRSISLLATGGAK